jgi:hypothetical protein
MPVIDTGDADAIFLRKNVGRGEPATVKTGTLLALGQIREMYPACSSLMEGCWVSHSIISVLLILSFGTNCNLAIVNSSKAFRSQYDQRER